MSKIYYSSVTNPDKIVYKNMVGSNMMLYLVANNGSSTLFDSTPLGSTLDAVKSLRLGVAGNVPGSNYPHIDSATLPMMGQSANLTFPTTAVVPIALTRVPAKVMLTVKNLLTTGYPQLTVTSVQLRNVPNEYPLKTVNTANGFDGSTDAKRYPVAAPGNITDYSSVAGNVSATGTNYMWYVSPNTRGISSNTNERLKSNETAPTNQGPYCTFVDIWATAKASATAPAVAVRYRLYLGGNNTNDFNLHANTVYTVAVELTGINGNDARMRITTGKFDPMQNGTDGDHSDNIEDWTAPAVGDYYYSDGSYSTTLKSGKTVEGIIFYASPFDPRIYKVISLWETSGWLAWAAKNTYVIGADGQSLTDGKANAVAIKKYSADHTRDASADTQTTGVFGTDFPAIAECYKYKGRAGNDAPGTWYVPAKNDLQYLYCANNGEYPVIWEEGSVGAPAADYAALTAWRARETNAGGNSSSSILFSSTECLITSSAFWLSRGDGSTENHEKTTAAGVRCVRTIAPPAIGDLRDGGIVYEVKGSIYKVFSLDQGTSLMWSAKSTTSVMYGMTDTDGKSNASEMKGYSAEHRNDADATTKTTGVFATDFPAAAFCDQKGNGWYLPAIDELKVLRDTYFNNKSIIDASIGYGNGAGFLPVTPPYLPLWSSSEETTSQAWGLGFTFLSQIPETMGKTMLRDVRCIRQINP